MDFYGIKLETTNFERIERFIKKIKVEVKDKAQQLYNQLLSHEIQIMIDETVLGLHDNDRIESIFDEAVKLLNKKIAVTIAKGFDTEYNLGMALNVFNYNGEVYIEAATHNRDLFDSIFNLKNEKFSDMSFNSEKQDPENRHKSEIWKNIIEEYKDHSCLTVKICPLSSFDKPDYSDLNFDSTGKRAELLARQRLCNRYLNMYAGGGDIPPSKLMEYMEQSLSKILTPEAKGLIDQYTSELNRILPEITSEIVMTKFTDKATAKQQITEILENTNKDEEDESDKTEQDES